MLCSPSLWGGGRVAGLLGEHGDHVVALGRGDPFPRVLLAVDLLFHKEVALLLEVDLAVCAGVALRVAELIPQLHHQTPAVVEGEGNAQRPSCTCSLKTKSRTFEKFDFVT